LSIVIIEDEAAEEPDIFDPRAAAKPNDYSLDGSEWTKHLTQLRFTNNEIQ